MGIANKIMVVAVTKIESDIVESFVRHALSFADEILIADNGSFDGTQEILCRLQEEKLPVHWERLPYRAEFDHAGMMLSLVREAVKQYQADIVLPLDIDEFLVNTENGVSIRDVLQNLDRAKVYHVHMYQYELLSPYTDSSQFLLGQPCVREPLNFGEKHRGKVIVGAEALKDEAFRLIQGCHYAYRETPNGDESVPLHIVPLLHVAHFHWRCNERYSIKTVLGWLGTASKYTVHAFSCNYMKIHYEKIMRGEIDGFDKTMGASATEPVDLKAFCTPQQMRYGNLVRAELLPIALKECERIAEAYAEEKIIHRGKIVDVLIPFFGDTKSLRDSLHVVKKQTYPHIEIFILNYTEAEVVDLEGFGEVSASVVDCSGKSRDHAAARLSEGARGDYVQWLLPGGILDTTHIQKMVAVFETQDFKFPFIVANQMQPFDALRPYLDICGGEDCRIIARKLLWQNMLAMGKYPANGMDDVLIPSHVMRARGWLLECLSEDGARVMSMWRLLLKEKPEDETSLGLYAFQDDSPYIHEVSTDSYIRHQMEWLELLSAEGELLSEGGLEQALNELLSNYHHLSSVCDAEKSQMFRAYQEAMQAFEAEC